MLFTVINKDLALRTFSDGREKGVREEILVGPGRAASGAVRDGTGLFTGEHFGKMNSSFVFTTTFRIVMLVICMVEARKDASAPSNSSSLE